MQHADIPTVLQPQLFFPLFVFGWLTVTGLLAHLSGWRSLAQRFPARAVEGERFRFASANLGKQTWLPVSYSNCLFFTVARSGLSISVFFPFRFLSPEMHIPWSQVDSVEEKSWLLGRRTEVRIHGSSVKLSLLGRVAKSVSGAYASSASHHHAL
jgi:hypothetical protein